jgi:hypothetical protein
MKLAGRPARQHSFRNRLAGENAPHLACELRFGPSAVANASSSAGASCADSESGQ